MSKIQIALFFADGRAYFAGTALLAVSLLVPVGPKAKRLSLLTHLLLIVGALMIILSSTPAPVWFYVLWLLVTLAWFVLHARPSLGKTRRRLLLTVAFAFCVIAVAMEYPHRRLPHIEPRGGTRVCVIGDSLSAGLGPGETTWPNALRSHTGLDVLDLSQPGATAESAMAQARHVPAGPGIVIVEIGGNDLLGDTSAREFERDLRRLLEFLQGTHCRLVMFELPLPPFFHAYGRIQRRLASEFSVTLIPKRVLAGVIASPEGTLDGLHLSDAGHRTIAETVLRVIR